jgi:hypothetical protein
MSESQPITIEYFMKRLVDLCLRSGLSGFPKNDVDQHILLKSAAVTIGQPGSFTEKELNEKLEYWVKHIGQIKNIDRITLRRRLVDTGYLTRNKDGSSYQVAQPGPRTVLFDEAIDQMDILEVLTAAREEMARKKREYLEKSRGH